MRDFTTSFVVDRTPQDVFAAINDVRGWWGRDVDGANGTVGDVFTYRVQGVHCSKLRVVDLVPGEKVAWLVLENHMSFVEDQTEWVGTTISFELAPVDGGTEVRFAHLGLDSGYECFEVCAGAWTSLMRESLPSLITTGTGLPYS